MSGRDYGVMRHQIVRARVRRGIAKSHRHGQAWDVSQSKGRGRQRQCVLLREAPEDGRVSEIVIRSDIALIPTLPEHRIGDLVVRKPRGVGRRVGLDKPAGYGVESGRRDDASGKRGPRVTTCGTGSRSDGERIEDWTHARKIPGADGKSRDRVHGGEGSLAFSKALVIGKEE